MTNNTIPPVTDEDLPYAKLLKIIDGYVNDRVKHSFMIKLQTILTYYLKEDATKTTFSPEYLTPLEDRINSKCPIYMFDELLELQEDCNDPDDLILSPATKFRFEVHSKWTDTMINAMSKNIGSGVVRIGNYVEIADLIKIRNTNNLTLTLLQKIEKDYPYSSSGLFSIDDYLALLEPFLLDYINELINNKEELLITFKQSMLSIVTQAVKTEHLSSYKNIVKVLNYIVGTTAGGYKRDDIINHVFNVLAKEVIACCIQTNSFSLPLCLQAHAEKILKP